MARNPGLVWISITGYGRAGEAGDWVAFGDDAGVSAGLSALLTASTGSPIFCGDAIADPLTGLHAALIALSQWRRGTGGLFPIALRDVVAHCIAFDGDCSADTAHDRRMEWQSFLNAQDIVPMPPAARRPNGRARPLGADTNAALGDLGIAC